MVNALWLASWYPGRNDPFDGDFIERHATAVSRFAKITLLYVSKDGRLKNNCFEIEETTQGNLTVYKVYYGRSGWTGFAEQLLSYWKYNRLQKKLYRQIVAAVGKPDIVHVQVAMKAGVLALWLKKKYKIPFIVTEHWSGYYPDIVPNIYSSNWLIKRLNKKILKEAAMFFPVADSLGKMVNDHFIKVPFKVIPNCVDTSVFFYRPLNVKRFRFIHPSSMIAIKNAEGILKAFQIVQAKGYPAELLMLGAKPAKLLELCHQLNINDTVIFNEPVPYEDVACQMQTASALVLFSYFENSPCVILEALCCGLPVVSSGVGGVKELLNNENGITVKSDDTNALAMAMMQVMDSYAGYNRPAIAAKANALYNYDAVGKQYAIAYAQIVASNASR